MMSKQSASACRQQQLHCLKPSFECFRQWNRSKRLLLGRELICHGNSPCPGYRIVVHTRSFEDYILETQQEIISRAETLDGMGRFVHDRWERESPTSGYGITSVLEGGNVLEKAAVNISVIEGVLSPERAQAMSSRGREGIDPSGGQPYSAAALSLVFHSAHPFIPTLRADVRLFEVDGMKWYGGGCDLTPFYIDEADITSFHRYWKCLCDAHEQTLYPEFKSWCDRYFYIPARNEFRGVGGIFFDDLDAQQVSAGNDRGAFNVEAFVQDVGRGIIPSWEPIVERNKNKCFEDSHRDWQLLRRGRYLEFNLLYDRGVKFGLKGGRIESIMVSAPPLIAWKYNKVPEPGSEEEKLVDILREPREWV